jgi:hypothetical protein
MTDGSKAMSRDALSALLRAARLRGAVFHYVSNWADRAAQTPPAREIVPAVMPGAKHVMAFHLVAKDNGWAALSGLAPVRLAAGDIIMFPHGNFTSSPAPRAWCPSGSGAIGSSPRATMRSRYPSPFTKAFVWPVLPRRSPTRTPSWCAASSAVTCGPSIPKAAV